MSFKKSIFKFSNKNTIITVTPAKVSLEPPKKTQQQMVGVHMISCLYSYPQTWLQGPFQTSGLHRSRPMLAPFTSSTLCSSCCSMLTLSRT